METIIGHSVGDGLIVAALAAAVVAYLSFRHLERRRRLELIHQERLVAIGTVRSIGRAIGNAVAASFADGFVHDRSPSADRVLMQGDGVIRAVGKAPSASPAQRFIDNRGKSLALPGAPGHGRGG